MATDTRHEWSVAHKCDVITMKTSPNLHERYGDHWWSRMLRRHLRATYGDNPQMPRLSGIGGVVLHVNFTKHGFYSASDVDPKGTPLSDAGNYKT